MPDFDTLAVVSADVQGLLLQLLLIFVAAQVGGEIAQRLKAPAVVGEIAAGVAIGPSVLNWVEFKDGKAPEVFEVLAEVGVVFLMFSIGLETQLGTLKKIGRLASQVAVLGVVVPFAFGIGWAAASGYPFEKQAFIATAFVATSVGITARVLADMGLVQRIESRVILAAAVLDDILAMLMLAAVIAMQSLGPTGGPSAGLQIAILAGQAILFVVFLLVLLPRFLRRHHKVVELPISPHSPFTLSIILCLGLGVLASEIGLAAIIGAFLAGVVLAEIAEEYRLEEQLRPLLYFLTPFFFVVTGMKVDAQVFARVDTLMMVAVVTTLAFAGKVIGCYLGSLRLGKRSALAVGIGMAPRGEVGIIIAAIGLATGVFGNEVYGVVIAMSLLTSIIAPPLMAGLMRKPAGGAHVEERPPSP